MREKTKLGIAASLHLAVFSAGVDGDAAVAIWFGLASALVFGGSVFYQVTVGDDRG